MSEATLPAWAQRKSKWFNTLATAEGAREAKRARTAKAPTAPPLPTTTALLPAGKVEQPTLFELSARETAAERARNKPAPKAKPSKPTTTKPQGATKAAPQHEPEPPEWNWTLDAVIMPAITALADALTATITENGKPDARLRGWAFKQIMKAMKAQGQTHEAA